MVTVCYKVAFSVVRNKEPHIIGKQRIMPAAKALMKHFIADKTTIKLNSGLLSNNTIPKHIAKMSSDINKQVLSGLKI